MGFMNAGPNTGFGVVFEVRIPGLKWYSKFEYLESSIQTVFIGVFMNTEAASPGGLISLS